MVTHIVGNPPLIPIRYSLSIREERIGINRGLPTMGNTGAGDNHHTKWPKSLYYYFVRSWRLWLWLSISTRVIVPCYENRGNRQISGDMNPLHSLDEGKASDELWRVKQMFMWEQWMLTLVGIVGLSYRCSSVIFQLLSNNTKLNEGKPRSSFNEKHPASRCLAT